MNNETRNLIQRFSPMWTNKQVWEFDQINEDLRFDVLYTEKNHYDEKDWKTKSAYLDSDIRDIVVRTFEKLDEGYELWISNKNKSELDEKYIPYLMAVMTDVMIDEEICLNFRLENKLLVISIDREADIIDCKEFFEEFYHLATGFNYDIDTGIPEDQTEAEIYLTRLQEEFDEKMIVKLGENYLPGNNDPDTLHSKDT